LKTQEQRIEDPGRSRSKAQLEATTDALFRRCPGLCGFTVQHAGGLLVSEITLDPTGGSEKRGDVCAEIVTALVELIDECPEARELLLERTFARTLH
jgi:hypothetical protein